MFKIAYQFINPDQNRSVQLLKYYNDGKEISEAVSEIIDGENEKILVFICLAKRGVVSHLCWGRKGNKAATELTRLNLERVEPISNIDTSDLIYRSDFERYKSFFSVGGVYLNPNLCSEFINKMRSEFQDINNYIEKSEIDYELIDRLDDQEKQIVIKEQDAVEMALRFGGMISRKEYVWSPTSQNNKSVVSFFSGLEKKKLSEDDVVRYDLNKIPGFSVIKELPFGYYLLGGEDTHLHVFHANKNPLENTFGVDLIYFNEDHKSFIFLQYKMAEFQGKEHIFRIPNAQLAKEIARMDNLMKIIMSMNLRDDQNVLADDFRLTENPFFLKICPRDDFDPDRYEQIKGMIIPIELWKDMENDDSHKYYGPNGGKYISFENCPRYFDNTAFISLLRKGWVGTGSKSALFLESAIKEIIEENTSLIFAAKLASFKSEIAPSGVEKNKKARRKK